MANDVTIDIGAKNLASAVLDRVKRDVKGLGTVTKRVSAGVVGGLKSMASAFGGLKIAAAAATAGFGLAVRTFANFDQGMAQVSAVTGAAGKELDALRDKAKEMGSSTQFSASQAAEAMKFLGMAGYDTQQIIEGIGPTLSLAAAGALELGQAADIASDVSSAFGLAAKDIGRVADVLATTATSANTTVEMLGETFQFAAPVAKAASQSIEEVSVAAGILGNSGIKASSAGTDLKNVMIALSKQDTADKIKALGVQITDATGEMRPMLDVMRDFGSVTSSMTGPDRLATAIDIFGKISGKSALILSDAGDQVEKLRGKMDAAEGSAKRMADVMQNNLGGVWTRMKSALEGLAIELVEGLSPALTDIGGMITDKFSSMATFLEENKSAVSEFGKSMVAAFETALPLMDMAAVGLWEIGKVANDYVLPVMEKLVDVMGKIPQFRADLASGATGFMEWITGQKLAPTVGGGLNNAQSIVGGIFGVGQQANASANAIGAGEAAVSGAGVGLSADNTQDRYMKEMLDELKAQGKKERFYNEVAMRQQKDLVGSQSRIASLGRDQRNPVVMAIQRDGEMRKRQNADLVKGFQTAADRIVEGVGDYLPQFKVLGVEVVEA